MNFVKFEPLYISTPASTLESQFRGQQAGGITDQSGLRSHRSLISPIIASLIVTLERSNLPKRLKLGENK